jgi:diguanylate cyclase (GGDEF)-like protein
LLAIILWPHTSRERLLVWLIALGFSSVLRIALFLAYRKSRPARTEILAWERPYLFTLLLSSAIWGFGSLWLIPPDSMMYAIVVYCFLIGMAGGAVSAYSAIHSYAIAAVSMVMLPTSFWMLTRTESTPVLMGIGAAMLFVALTRASRVISSAFHENFLLTHQLKESKEVAERQARIDALTGLHNRLAFAELAQCAIRHCQRSGLPYAAIVLDVDNFKSINDKRGHAVGDQALQHVAGVLQNSLRRSDVCARVGGEEFAVLLPGTEEKAAIMVAEKIRESIAYHPLETSEGLLENTVSVGVASMPLELDALLQLADKAMYAAKQAGRNCVVCHPVNSPQENLSDILVTEH